MSSIVLTKSEQKEIVVSVKKVLKEMKGKGEPITDKFLLKVVTAVIKVLEEEYDDDYEWEYGDEDEIDYAGAGFTSKIKDWYSKVKHVIFNTGSPKTDQAVKKYTGYRVMKIEVCREVVEKVLTTILNAVSLGKLNKYKDKYDDLYHLYAILQMKAPDGNIIYVKTEKRPNIYWEEVDGFVDLPEYDTYGHPMSYTVNYDKLGIPIYFENMIPIMVVNMGEKYSKYNPVSNNCQLYIYNLVKAGFEITTPGPANEQVMKDFDKFINQDVKSYVTGVSKSLATGVTSLGHAFGRLTGGFRFGVKLW